MGPSYGTTASTPCTLSRRTIVVCVRHRGRQQGFRRPRAPEVGALKAAGDHPMAKSGGVGSSGEGGFGVLYLCPTPPASAPSFAGQSV
jgi:hypothetical protein